LEQGLAENGLAEGNVSLHIILVVKLGLLVELVKHREANLRLGSGEGKRKDQREKTGRKGRRRKSTVTKKTQEEGQ
jgi:hypothetical protein